MALKHLLFLAIPSWGHIRPFCILAARLVKEHKDVVLTLFIPFNMISKTEDEISYELHGPERDGDGHRIRIISICKPTSQDPLKAMAENAAAYPAAYQALVESKPITCAASGKVFDSLPAPSVVIVDYFGHDFLLATRSITEARVPVIAWVTGYSSSIIYMYGPESMGGFGDLSAKIKAEALRRGVSTEEVGDSVYRGVTGKIIKVPGLPEMYDYEFFPQKTAMDSMFVWSDILIGNRSLLMGCDGVLAVNAHTWESEAIDAMKSWFSEWNKKLYAIGPLLPSGLGSEKQSNRGNDSIKSFLDTMLVKEGSNSVVLISFGTIFWPADTTFLDEVVEALIEKNFPFILSHASPFSKVTDDFKKKVADSGIGLLTTWCPQQYILDHPATGWFLSHCGHNSATEALASGVPLIAWPYESDQPAAALHLSTLGLGIELLEVRTGTH